MTAGTIPYQLGADRPLADPSQDVLGYAPFARQLSNSIATMAPPDGLVLGVYGPWGSGKTTAINFLLHYLNELPDDQQPFVVSFNPWRFSGQEDLTRRFFVALSTVLRDSRATALADKLGDFADAVSAAPLPWWARLFGHGAKRYVKFKGSIDNKREALEHALERQDRNILVVLDDLDRLTEEEVRQIFRLIKAVANFPRTIYLLAFDKDVVIPALGRSQELPGSKYLEKIIQVPFELPLPEKTDLWRLFTQHLDQVIADVPQDRFDQVYWSNIFHEGIAPFLSTPRDVVRLTNALRVTYPAVHGEVNPVDFTAIETLRVFAPSVYDVVRQNTDRFAGHSGDFDAREREREQAFLDAMLATVAEGSRCPVKDVLVRLFPRLDSVWGNMHWGYDWLARWRRDLRVCSPDCFPVYFRLALPAGAISAAEMDAAIALLDNPEAFAQRLLDLASEKRADGRTRVSTFLERLTDYADELIPERVIPNAVQTLFSVGDKLILPEDERQHMYDLADNGLRIGWVIWPLLERLSEAERFTILRESCLQSDSTSLIVDKVGMLARQHGKYTQKPAKPDDERLITADHLEELEHIALETVRTARDAHTLIDTPALPQVLWRWRDWANESEVRTWAKDAVSTNEGLVKYLGHYLQKSFSHGMNDHAARTTYRLDPKWLAPFVLPDDIIDRARSISTQHDIGEEERRAVECFISEYELRQSGQDPNNRLDD